MPNRSATLPIESIKFNIFSEDLAFLKAEYGEGAVWEQRLGYGPAMREIIHAAVVKLRAKKRLATSLQGHGIIQPQPSDRSS